MITIKKLKHKPTDSVISDYNKRSSKNDVTPSHPWKWCSHKMSAWRHFMDDLLMLILCLRFLTPEQICPLLFSGSRSRSRKMHKHTFKWNLTFHRKMHFASFSGWTKNATKKFKEKRKTILQFYKILINKVGPRFFEDCICLFLCI